MISARCDYACRALLELALCWPNNKPIGLGTIAKRQNIPIRYLVQILLQLKRIGIVESVRGRDGGYNLTKPPNAIRLAEVMRQIGGQFLPVSNSSGRKGSIFMAIWKDAEETMAGVLNKFSFEDIANGLRGARRTALYQI